MPPPETGDRVPRARGQADQRRARRAAGGSSARPEKVRAGLEELAAEYGADEVIVVTITYDHEARRRSYELIAEVMDLAHQPATEVPAPLS